MKEFYCLLSWTYSYSCVPPFTPCNTLQYPCKQLVMAFYRRTYSVSMFQTSKTPPLTSCLPSKITGIFAGTRYIFTKIILKFHIDKAH